MKLNSLNCSAIITRLEKCAPFILVFFFFDASPEICSLEHTANMTPPQWINTFEGSGDITIKAGHILGDERTIVGKSNGTSMSLLSVVSF